MKKQWASKVLTADGAKQAISRGLSLRAYALELKLTEGVVSGWMSRNRIKWPKAQMRCANGHERAGNTVYHGGRMRCGVCQREQQLKYRENRFAAKVRAVQETYEARKAREAVRMVVPRYSWIGWMEQCTREECLPPYLRGKADEMKRWLTENKIAQ